MRASKIEKKKKKKQNKQTNKQEGSSNWVGFNFNDAILPVIQKKRVGSVKQV